jgi:hypothetical protein
VDQRIFDKGLKRRAKQRMAAMREGTIGVKTRLA